MNSLINIIVKICDGEKQSVSHELRLRLVFLMFPWDMQRTGEMNKHTAFGCHRDGWRDGQICTQTHRHADKQADTQMDGHTGGLTA